MWRGQNILVMVIKIYFISLTVTTHTNCDDLKNKLQLVIRNNSRK